jgi:multiple sugar transport system permease protein
MNFKGRSRIIGVVVSVVYLTLLYIPVYWLFLTSFKRRIDIFTRVPKLFFSLTWEHYLWIVKFEQILKGLGNSVIVAIVTTAISLGLGVPCAYAFSKKSFYFRGRDNLKFWVITVRMLPPVAAVLPLYMIWLRFGLYDTHFALIFTYLLFTLPLVTWLMSGFFMQIPEELGEAAKIDGAGVFGIFWRIELPLGLPGLIVSLIFSFILVWGDLFISFILTTHNITLPVALAGFVQEGKELKYGAMCAAGSISAIPGLILAILGRKFVLRGMQGLSEFVR